MLSKDQRETDQTQKKGKGYAKPLRFGSELFFWENDGLHSPEVVQS